MAVGFGIATAEQVRTVTSLADGAVVGSALVSRIAAAAPAERVTVAQEFVAELKTGCRAAARER